MTDIVERLRSGANCDWAKPTRLDIWAAFTRFVDLGEKREWSAADVLNDAADEIDRLRGLLREARPFVNNRIIDVETVRGLTAIQTRDLLREIDAALGADSETGDA